MSNGRDLCVRNKVYSHETKAFGESRKKISTSPRVQIFAPGHGNQDSQKLARAIISAFDAVLDAEQDAGILA